MRILVVLCLLLVSLHLEAQNPFMHFKLRHWTTKNGLKDNNILMVHCAKDGFVWIGSYVGLTRFDGVNFKLYNTQNVPNLKTNSFNSIQETADTTLWFTTQNNGLYAYKKGQFKSYFREVDFLNNSYLDPQDQLVLMTDEYDKVIVLDAKTKKYRHFAPDDFLQQVVQGKVQAFAQKDSKGNLWFINPQDRQLYRIRQGKIYLVAAAQNLPDTRFTRVFVDSRDRVWLTSIDKLWLKDANEFRQLPEMAGFNYERAGFYKLGFPDNTVRFYEDRQGGIWLYNPDGLFYLAPHAQSFAALPPNHPLRKVKILDLTGDMENNIWIASEQGLFQLSESSFVTYTSTPYDFSNKITGVAALSNEEYLLCGTANGGEVFWIKNGQYFPYNYKNPALNNANFAMDVKHVFLDSKKQVWIADAQATVCLSQEGEKIITRNKSVRYIYEDEQKNIWLAIAFEGIFRWTEEETLEKLHIPELDFSNYFLSSIRKTQEGDWIITSFNNGFVIVSKDGSIQYFNDDNKLPTNTIFNSYEGKNGAIWFTTNAGLVHLQANKIRRITIEDGMPVNSVFDFLLDNQGYLWLPSNEGVIRVSKQGLENYIAGRSKKIAWRMYDEQDGMENKNCTGARHSTITENGKILIPTFGGLLEVTPSKLSAKSLVIPITIHQVLWDKEAQDLSKDTFVFEPGSHRLMIDYTAFSYHAPKKLNFKYRLVGYDDDWIEAGTERRAVYTRLPRGHYTFEVLVSNLDGVWSKKGASFSFVIKPYFYETWWFITLAIMAIILCIWGVFRWRVYNITQRNKKLEALIAERTKELLIANKRIKASNEEVTTQKEEISQQNTQLLKLNDLKDRVFSIISHDLRSPINSLQGLLSIVGNEQVLSPQELQQYIIRLSENVKGVSGLLDNLLYWARSQMQGELKLSPEKLDLSAIIQEVIALFAETAQVKKITTRVALGEDIPEVYADAEILRFVLRNLLNNAYKFSRQGGVVRLSAQETPNQVKILIQDEGLGIDQQTQETLFKGFVKSRRGTQSEKGTGLGLMLCREFVELSKGQIGVESEEGQGSLFWFTLPKEET